MAHGELTMTAISIRNEEHWVSALCFLTDMLVFTFALHVATLTVIGFIDLDNYSAVMVDRLVCVALFGVACAMGGVYRHHRLTDRFDAIYFVLLALLVALVAQTFLTKFVMRDRWVLSRRELLLSVGIAAPLLAAWRFVAAGALASYFPSLHRFYFILGDDAEARRIASVINHTRSLHAQAATITLDALKRKCEEADLGQAAPRSMAEEIIIAHTRDSQDALTDIIELCDAHFSRTFLYPTQHDAVVFQHHHLQPVAGIPLIQVAGQQRVASYPAVKRLMDVVVATAGLVFSAPLLLVTAIAIKLTSPGPILFVQDRLGRNGRPFKMYKFRSMRHDAKGNSAPVRATPDDPRITRVGRVIRKYKIDE
ncbi:MAG TPA: hypothetical protein ENN80_12600, partial [Candidatus Hydrogenedentes bacterium]|nr:hypothetical protein [Candidatus Hydrogenedentota bacterium]